MRNPAQQQRHMRQEALREMLAGNLHHQQVVWHIDRMLALEVDADGTNERQVKFELDKFHRVAELRLKLIHKYLPDLKSVEATVEQVESHDDWVKRANDDPA